MAAYTYLSGDNATPEHVVEKMFLADLKEGPLLDQQQFNSGRKERRRWQRRWRRRRRYDAQMYLASDVF